MTKKYHKHWISLFCFLLILLEWVEFLDDASANQAHSVDYVLVKQFDGGLVGFWLAVTQNVVVSQGNDNEDSGKREDRVKEADLLDEDDEQAEVQQA